MFGDAGDISLIRTTVRRLSAQIISSRRVLAGITLQSPEYNLWCSSFTLHAEAILNQCLPTLRSKILMLVEAMYQDLQRVVGKLAQVAGGGPDGAKWFDDMPDPYPGGILEWAGQTLMGVNTIMVDELTTSLKQAPFMFLFLCVQRRCRRVNLAVMKGPCLERRCRVERWCRRVYVSKDGAVPKDSVEYLCMGDKVVKWAGGGASEGGGPGPCRAFPLRFVDR